jgi:type II secretory pathway component GspD/PulD (secretin)
MRQLSAMAPLEAKADGPGVKYTRDEPMDKEKRKEQETKWSDTLIVTDTEDMLNLVAEIIQKLDVRPRQVSIEARIVEISLDAAAETGINWQIDDPDTKALLKFAPEKLVVSSGLQFGTIDAKVLDRIMGAIQLLETEGKAKVLATPSTTSLDNELAQIIVSDRIPLRTVYASESYTTTSYTYLDVGINLTVTPHIGEGGNILLELNPRIDSIKGAYDGADAPPIISSRVANTRVAVKDGETLVIGGLMKEETNESVSRLPVVGRIPLIGRLFSSREKINRKTDLMVFITPRIMTP